MELLSLTECVWEFKNNAFWDTHYCALLLLTLFSGISPDLSTENLLQSIAAALHLSNHPIVGQSQSTAKFAKNPTVHVNTNQPLIQVMMAYTLLSKICDHNSLPCRCLIFKDLSIYERLCIEKLKS